MRRLFVLTVIVITVGSISWSARQARCGWGSMRTTARRSSTVTKGCGRRHPTATIRARGWGGGIWPV